MENTTRELAAIITNVQQNFPDSPDLKGFLGISRKLIVDSLQQSRDQLALLKEHDENFEVIVLKRELAKDFRHIGDYLKMGFEGIKPKAFDHFLTIIAHMKFLIRETYLSVVAKDHFRAEAEIVQLKTESALLAEQINDLKQARQQLLLEKENTISAIQGALTEIISSKTTGIQQILTGVEEVNELKTTTIEAVNLLHSEAASTKNVIDTLSQQAQDILTAANTNAQNIAIFAQGIEILNTDVSTSHDNVAAWSQEIAAAKETITAAGKEYAALNKQMKSAIEIVEEAKEQIIGVEDSEGNLTGGYLADFNALKKNVNDFLQAQHTKYDTQFKEIEGLLPGATSAGLAQAYQDQKQSYTKPIRNWSSVFVITLCLMIAFSLYVFFIEVNARTIIDLNSALTALLRYLPFYFPTIWLVAYASKQQSQSKRLQQEYAFKETNAKSFHGHKVQIEELMKEGATDKELLEKLVATLVYITAQNPSQTLENKSHDDAPPTFKWLERMVPRFRSGKAATVEPEQG